VQPLDLADERAEPLAIARDERLALVGGERGRGAGLRGQGSARPRPSRAAA
jgi:hypothetical protein